MKKRSTIIASLRSPWEKYSNGEKVFVTIDGINYKAKIVGRLWSLKKGEACWLVKLKKIYSDKYPFFVLIALDKNIEEREVKHENLGKDKRFQ